MINLTVPKLRMWHLMGIVAASAAFFSVMQFRWTVEDEGYALLRRLRSADAMERTKAAYGLSRLRPREHRAIAPLTEMLFDTNAEARAAAAEALNNIMGSNGRRKSEFDEAEIGPVKAALASVLGDRDPAARLAIARTLGFLGTEPKVIVPTLLEFAKDTDPQTRRDAVSILGAYVRRSEPAMAAVFDAIDDANSEVRSIALDELAYVAVVPNVVAEPLLGRIKDAIASRSADTDQNVRQSAVWALVRIGRRTKTEDPRIIRFLSDPDLQVRLSAWDSLTTFQPSKRSPEFVPSLERILRDSEASVRQTAALKLGRFGLQAESVLPSLRASLDDPDHTVRLAAADSIEAIEKDIQKFRSETLPPIITELTDADPIVRALAASRIEDFGPRASDAVPALVKCLADREADVRRASASALGQLGPGAAVAVPSLTNLVESDSDERVRQTATIARAILLRGNGSEGHDR
jgi:HEAT repeat protein